MLIPVVFVALILTHNAPHSILTRSDSAAETHHLTAPALETPSRETGNIYPLELPVSEDITILVPPDRGYEDTPAEVAIASQVSSNTGPDQTTPAVNKLTFAAPEKSASPVPDPVIETDTGTETGTREVVTALPEGPEQGTLIHRGDWLLKQPPGHYMLQLLATRNEILLLQLLAENHPGGLVAYYKDHIKARDWYILLYGQFSTRQTALDAIGSLPKEYQGNHPWPRSLASVQAILLRQRDRTAR
jgi:DamX protein